MTIKKVQMEKIDSLDDLEELNPARRGIIVVHKGDFSNFTLYGEYVSCDGKEVVLSKSIMLPFVIDVENSRVGNDFSGLHDFLLRESTRIPLCSRQTEHYNPQKYRGECTETQIYQIK